MSPGKVRLVLETVQIRKVRGTGYDIFGVKVVWGMEGGNEQHSGDRF